jgi:hypothetical protein
MKRTLFFLLLGFSLLATTVTGSDENLAITGSPKQIKLTIYGNNLVMVQEQRSVTLEKAGKVKLMYPGVPTSIDTSSILAHFSQPVKLYSQNYSFDVISYASLLKYHLGKQINYIEKEDSIEIKEGTLLATNPLLVQERNFGVIFKPYQVFFPKIPRDMAVKPSLFWNIETQATSLDITLKYLAHGMSWKSDYTIALHDDGTLDLNSWITISNHSGAAYADANITVLAGDVNVPKPMDRRRVRKTVIAYAATADAVESEDFSGYHIYHIPFRETIKDKEKKQIAFIEKSAIAYEKYGLSRAEVYFSSFGERKLHFDQVISFQNSQANQLGIPLPRGTIRVYSEDKSGTSRFVGASQIANIPKDEEVKLTIGKYFDIVGTERVSDYRETRKEAHITYHITLKNHSERKERIKIEKRIPVNRGKLTITDNCQAPCSRNRLDAFSSEYTIDLDANKAYELTVTYDLLKY